MLSVTPFAPGLAEPLLALWRALHPDWTWLDAPATAAKLLEPSAERDRLGYVVRRGDAVIASVFGVCARDDSRPRTRYINIEARPEDVAADWLDPLLAELAAADRAHPGTWQVASPAKALWDVLAPRLVAAGFALRSTALQMEWNGDVVAAVDPGPVRLQSYAGGDPAIDRAIVDLHNRAYRTARLVPPADAELLWQSWPALEMREYVLAWDGKRLVGFAEWFVTAGAPYINSMVAARSHWGTPVGAAVGTRAMQILVERGYRRIESSVTASNAASMALHLKHGWRVAGEQARSYVRAF